jgi:hypothetical protein
MSTEQKNYTCKFSLNNEYVQRLLNADNGLYNAMMSMKEGDTTKYKEYYSKITNGKTCKDGVAEFWNKEVLMSQNIQGEKPPRAMFHRNSQGASRSMNIDHSMLFDGDIFLMDGNHRIEAAMIRGEEPIVMFDITRNLLPEWKAVLNAKSDPIYRVKHQPHPHPILWDLNPYRTMESCQTRYGELAKHGIKSTYEVGCAEGVGVWILRKLGVNANGSEVNAPARTLAQSLIKDKIDTAATPEKLPQVECLILYSVLYHLLSNSLTRDAWINKIKEYPCAALELSTKEENEEKDRYRHMANYDPLTWWPNRKLLHTDPKHANRETWLLWR